MASARNKNGRKHNIYESIKKGLDTLLKAFRDDEEAKGTLHFEYKYTLSIYLLLFLSEYTFDASLSTEERAYIHASAQSTGMKSRSQG